MGNCFLLLACLLFSFACNLIKKIYEDEAYTSTIDMLKNAFISGLAGFIFSLFFSDLLFHPILIVLFSGVGGFLGVNGLTFIIQARLGDMALTNSHFNYLFNEIFGISPTNNTLYTIVIDETIKNQYTAHKYFITIKYNNTS